MPDENKKVEGEKPKKEVVVVSRGSYKGFPIYETKKGFVVLFGMFSYISSALNAVTAFIDQLHDLRKN